MIQTGPSAQALHALAKLADAVSGIVAIQGDV